MLDGSWSGSLGIVLALVLSCGGGSEGSSAGRTGGATTTGGSTTNNGGSTGASGGSGAANAGARSGGASGAGAAGASGTAGRSGSGGAAGTTTNGGGSAGGVNARPNPATATPFEACVYYFRAQCNKRFFECEGTSAVNDPCPDFDSQCPDFLFSDSSRLNLADVIQCADRWVSAACEDVIRNAFPVCGLPTGTRPPASPCLFGSQCDSRTCATWATDAAHPGCGQCATVVAGGEACGGAQTCASGYECNGSKCQPLPEFGLAPGAACERYGQCAPPLFCITFPGQSRGTCQALPGLGEACPTDVARCKGGFCNSARVCQVGLPAGSSCSANEGCAQGLFCDSSGAAKICAPRRKLGESCKPYDRDFTVGNCLDGLCHCADAKCLTATCVERRDLGAACGEANVVCIPGTICKDGHCGTTGSQGLADSCPAQ